MVAGGGGGAIIGAGPDVGQAFALESKKDDVAFLGSFRESPPVPYMERDFHWTPRREPIVYPPDHVSRFLV